MSRRLAVSQLPKLRATEECDLSADSSAGMAGAASAAPDLKSDPPIRNLLRSKNGLDNGATLICHVPGDEGVCLLVSPMGIPARHIGSAQYRANHRQGYGKQSQR